MATSEELIARLRRDRVFRKRLLAARQAGQLAEFLAAEGYDPNLESLKISLPKVSTNITAGHCCGGSCVIVV